MRPAAFTPRGAAGNTLRCGEEGCDGKGRLEIGVDEREGHEGEGEGRGGGRLPVHPVKFSNRTIHHTIQLANPYSLSLSPLHPAASAARGENPLARSSPSLFVFP